MVMPTGEHCWKKNSGASWARTSKLWIPSLTHSPLRYLGRYVKWDLNTVLYITIVYSHNVTRIMQYLREKWCTKPFNAWFFGYYALIVLLWEVNSSQSMVLKTLIIFLYLLCFDGNLSFILHIISISFQAQSKCWQYGENNGKNACN